jgi:hypothetical protein
MRPDPSPVYPGPVLRSIKTQVGEHLIVDETAKLEKGCTVAVLQDGNFVLVGRILRKPVASRHLIIGYEDVHGNKGTTRIWGLKEKDVDIWRVVGVHTTVPF